MYIYLLHIPNKTETIKYKSHVNHINGVIVNVLASSVLDRWFQHWCGQAKEKALKGKSECWSVQNQDNVSVWSDTSTFGLLLQ